MKQSGLTKKQQKELIKQSAETGKLLQLTNYTNDSAEEQAKTQSEIGEAYHNNLLTLTENEGVQQAALDYANAVSDSVKEQVEMRAKELVSTGACATLDEARVVAANEKAAATTTELAQESLLVALKKKDVEYTKAVLAAKIKTIAQNVVDIAQGVILTTLSIAKGIVTNPVGAALAATIAAGVGVAGLTGISSAINSKNNSSKVSSNVVSNQDTIYNNKKNISSAKSLREEYAEILNRQASGTSTDDDATRAEEIESELKEIDSSLTATGYALLNQIDDFAEKTEDQNDELIEYNFDNLSRASELTDAQKTLVLQEKGQKDLHNTEEYQNASTSDRSKMDSNVSNALSNLDTTGLVNDSSVK